MSTKSDHSPVVTEPGRRERGSFVSTCDLCGRVTRRIARHGKLAAAAASHDMTDDTLWTWKHDPTMTKVRTWGPSQMAKP